MVSPNSSPDPLIMRKILPLLLFGVAGAVAVGFLIQDISPNVSADFQLSRKEILQKSDTFMRAIGYHLDGLQQDAWFNFDPRTQMFLQEKYGMAEANRICRADTLPTCNWEIQWYDRRLSLSQNPERITAKFSPGGKLIGFDHLIPDSAFSPSLSIEAARALAERTISQFHPDFATYHLKTSSDYSQLHRTDHHFQYTRNVDGFELLLDVGVRGNEVGSIWWHPEFSGDFQSEISAVATEATLTSTGSIAATFLLFFFVVTLFLRKYHEGEVGVRTGAMVFVGYLAIAILSQTNGFPSAGAGTGIGDLNKFYVRLIVAGLTVCVFEVFLGVLVFASWAVGESSSRSVWPRKLDSTDSALFRRFFTQDIAASILNGYGWGFVILGLHAVATWFIIKNGGLLLGVDRAGAIDSYLPGAQPIIFGILAAGFSEVVMRLFFMSYVAEKSRRRWLAVLVSVAAWTGTGFFLWDVPFGMPTTALHIAILAVYGLVFALLLLRYDLLTAICAHVVIAAVNAGIVFLLSSGQAFNADRWVFAGLLGAPLVVALVGLFRKERFEFSLETMPRHIQRISERVRMAKELEIARSVQLGLLPKEKPFINGYDIAGVCLPAEEVGGDYFDFVHLGRGKLGIALGDVSGKGVPAAIYMTLTKGILQSHAEKNVTPKEVLSKVNGLMYRTIERNSFVSMLYAILDGEQCRLLFARAGQCPVILTRDIGGKGSFLTPKGMALGLENGKVFDSVLQEQEIQLHQGETIVFYTDGFTEAMNERAEEFGEQRLVESVNRHGDVTAEGMIQAVCEDIKKFTGPAPQHDDMTMVVVKVCGEP